MVEQAREALASQARWGEARELFTKVLEQGPNAYRAAARTGLASLERVSDRPHEALDHLAEVPRLLAKLPADHAFVRKVMAEHHTELARCWLMMGLPDRAEADLSLAGSLVEDGDTTTSFMIGVSKVDLAIANFEFPRADWLLGRLQVPAQDSISAALARNLSAELLVRRALVGLRRVGPDDATAEALKRVFDDRSLAPGIRGRAGLELVKQLKLLRQTDLAESIAADLLSLPAENILRRAEAKAVQARLRMQLDILPKEQLADQEELANLVGSLFSDWRNQPLRSGGSGRFLYDARRELVATLIALDRRVLPPESAALVACQHLESALSLGTLSRRLGSGPVDPLLVQRKYLPPDGGILMYAGGLEDLHLILVDRDSIEHVELNHRVGLHDSMMRLCDEIEVPPHSSAENAEALVAKLASDLAADLLPQVVCARIRNWRSLVLVGEERLALAWQALPWGRGCIGTEFAVSHVPSLSLFVALEQRHRARPAAAENTALAIIADPRLTAKQVDRWGVGELQLSAAARKRLCADVPKPALVTRFGAEVTAAALRDEELMRASLWTIIAHGVTDYSLERSACILLGGPGDGVLRVAEVEQLRVPRLIALGVCNAAGGPRRVGDDGVHHLGGAFLSAGADAVVLAGGQLAVGATVELLSLFNAGVCNGLAPAEALRVARAAVRAMKGRSHPYFHASMRLSGLGQH